jgi:hypothetical protein
VLHIYSTKSGTSQRVGGKTGPKELAAIESAGIVSNTAARSTQARRYPKPRNSAALQPPIFNSLRENPALFS